MNIYLMGYRGSGKTTLGKHLAAALHRPFLDTDALLVERAKIPIHQIFQLEGEQGFRDRESAVIRHVSTLQNHVVALGGGAILRPQNVAALRSSGTLFFLNASPETLYARIQADPASPQNRPNLTSAGGLAEVQTLLAQRLPLYSAAAHHTLDVTHLSPEIASQHIIRLLELSQPPPDSGEAKPS